MRCRSKVEGCARSGDINRTGDIDRTEGPPFRGRVTASGLYNYQALAGNGSDTFRPLNGGRSWRAALLGAAAAGALWTMAPQPAKAGPDSCTVAGNVVTCTGDQSAGVSSNTDFSPTTVDTLDVNSLTTNITPPATGFGIYFKRSGASDTITINSDIAPHFISVTSADGIYANAAGGVTITNNGDITSSVIGIGAVSENAGAGGMVTIDNTGAITAAVARGIVAKGDSGVTVRQTGDVTVNGNTGIYAQSLYGGMVSVTATGGSITALGFGINAYSTSGAVSVTSGDAITVSTANGFGILAKGDLGATVRQTGDVSATGSGARGIYAYANHGAISVVSGGTITAAGDGIYARGAGDVSVQHAGDITTSAVGTGRGIYARSGQGGVNIGVYGNINTYGDGIYALTLSPPGVPNIVVNTIGDITSTHGSGILAKSSFGSTLSITASGDIIAYGDGIHAEGANPLSGGVNVTVRHTGNITSQTGRGIHASTGTGPSVAIINSGNISAQSDGIHAVDTGSGGTVAVTQTGDITSNAASGIYAFAFGAASITSTGNIKASGNGIYIYRSYIATVTSTGNIAAKTGYGIDVFSQNSSSVTSRGTIKAQLDGIHVLSNIGNVTVNSTGDITSVAGSGIYAQSASGNINVKVNGGTVHGSAAGIQVAQGSTNTITVGSVATVTGGTDAILGGTGNETVNNHGTVLGLTDLGDGNNTINNFGSMVANSPVIGAGAGTDTVNNSGIVTGDVDLGGGTNTFNNLAGGVFNSGMTVNLGAGNRLVNKGTLAPGGTGTVATTTLTGNFVQTASGKFDADVDLSKGTADRLNASGSANLAGAVTPHLKSLFGTAPQTFTIVSAASGANDNGLTVQSTAVLTYQLLFPNPTDVLLQLASINFAPPGLTRNERAVGKNLQQSYLAGGGGLTTLLTYLSALSFDPFATSLDRLTPEPYLAQAQTALWSSLDFASSLFSCPLPSSQASLLGEQSCYWLRPSGHVASLDAHDGYMGFTEHAPGITGGIQNTIAPDWYLDLGFGYERSNIDGATSSANGDVFHGGAALKYIRNNWLVAGSMSGSFARYDTSRHGIPTAVSATATADTSTLDSRLRLARAFGTPSFYVKPLVDFDAVGLWRGSIDENGAGALDLHVQGQTDWVFSAAPAVELGTQWGMGDYTWRPYVRAGLRFLSKDSFGATASFEGAPAGVAPFTVISPVDQTLAEVSAGIEAWQGPTYSLRVNYDGRFGSHTTENGGALEFRKAF